MANLSEHLHTILNGFLEPQQIEDILLKNIELLSRQVDIALINLLTEPNLKEITRGLFDSLIKHNDPSLPSKMEIYEIATSKSMLRLIIDMKDLIDGDAIKIKLTEKLMSVKATPSIDKFYIPLTIYSEVYYTIGAMLNGKRKNTSIVFETAKNAERSEFIEDLELKSYLQIINNFTDLTIHNKVSASPTIVFSGILKSDTARRLNAVRSETLLNAPRLFFKVQRSDRFAGYAIVEQAVYIELFKLVKYNITPHILCKVATNLLLPKFYDTMQNVSDNFKARLEKEMTKINLFLIEKGYLETDVPWDSTKLLVTQKGDEELYKILALKPSVDLDRLKNILFQLFYTLYVFENIECNHGDLHFGNVFVNKLPKVTTYYYKVNGILYKVSTDETVKIFDFDCSKIFKNTDVTVNMKKGMIIREVYNDRPQPGITNVYNKNIDKVKVLLDLIDNETLKPLIEQFFPGVNKHETVRQTYLRLLFSGDNQVQNRIEASRIFGIEISEQADIDKCKIGKSILDRSWKSYFSLIAQGGNWIIKSGTLDNYSQDHLWIPDEIVLPNKQILALLGNPVLEEINVRNGPVYTLDDRL